MAPSWAWEKESETSASAAIDLREEVVEQLWLGDEGLAQLLHHDDNAAHLGQAKVDEGSGRHRFGSPV